MGEDMNVNHLKTRKEFFDVSIVVPIYQVEQYIRASMISIANQNYDSFEVVLVDDGTKDNSIKIAISILEEKKIDYQVVSQENKGLSAARNAGIKAAKGDKVICIDSDDTIHPDLIRILINDMKQHDSDIAITSFQMVNNDNVLKFVNKIKDSYVLDCENIKLKFLTRKIIIIAPGILISKRLLVKNDIWYDEKVLFSEDQHFIWRLLFVIKTASYNSTPLYNYLERSNSIMTSPKLEKIISGYSGIIDLESVLKYESNNKLSEWLLPRWVLGVLGSTCKNIEYEKFVYLTEKLRYRENIIKLYKFPDFRVQILSRILIFSRKLFYLVNSLR